MAVYQTSTPFRLDNTNLQLLVSDKWPANNPTTAIEYETYKSFIYGPGQFPDCHIDMTNSRYPAATTCNLLNKIQDSRAELDQQFANDELTAGLPKLLISADRRETQNAEQYKFYMDQDPVIVNKPGCDEPFNARSLNDAADLQKGYARNIDLDSELRRINHFTDKCFYDSYKFHPDDATTPNGLYCNRDALIKDYSIVGQPNCARSSQPKSGITPPLQQISSKDLKYSSTNRVQYGTNLALGGTPPNELTRDYTSCNLLGTQQPLVNNQCQSGGIPKTFPQCKSQIGINARAQQIINWRTAQNHGQAPDYYMFNGDITEQQKRYTANYPCQRLFNNNTKRSNLPNMFNTFDPNPIFLS